MVDPHLGGGPAWWVVLVVVVLTTIALLLRHRRRPGRAAQDTPLRRAARTSPNARVPSHPVMRWVPDEQRGGWRLTGRYLPVAADGTAAHPPRGTGRG